MAETGLGRPSGMCGGKENLLLQRSGYRARFAIGAQDLMAARQLRSRCFQTDGLDGDAYDAVCQHILIEHDRTAEPVGYFRSLLLPNGAQIDKSYSAQFYDLANISSREGAVMELGRFCIDPDCRDADVVRFAWGAVALLVDRHDVGLLFGCTSFTGTDPGAYLDAFSLLQQRYLAPLSWGPGAKSPRALGFAQVLQGRAALAAADLHAAQAQLPPLLRSYLAMGGRVSDHLVVDHDLGTCHVFTGLEVDGVPRVRQRLLRAITQGH